MVSPSSSTWWKSVSLWRTKEYNTCLHDMWMRAWSCRCVEWGRKWWLQWKGLNAKIKIWDSECHCQWWMLLNSDSRSDYSNTRHDMREIHWVELGMAWLMNLIDDPTMSIEVEMARPWSEWVVDVQVRKWWQCYLRVEGERTSTEAGRFPSKKR